MEKGEERGEWENFFDIHKAADLTLETPSFLKKSNIQNLFVDYNRELVSFCHMKLMGNSSFLPKESRVKSRQNPKCRRKSMITNSLYLDCAAVGITLKQEVSELLLKKAGRRRKKKKTEP